MGIIPASVHRILDYLSVALFALAPTLFRLEGNTRLLAYGLAVVHLVMTLLTRFPDRRPMRGVIPFPVHGLADLGVGLLLIALPLLRHWTHGARTFYLGFGIFSVIVWLLTRYRDAAPAADAMVDDTGAPTTTRRAV
jgi:hypothetical protein